jgi:heme-degrading monooxygenase HmoA
MFVQLIRCKVKPDGWPKLEEISRRWEREQAPIAPGFRGEYVLREKGDPNRCIVVVLFDNEELARQNSNRPETDAFYREWAQHVEGEPEFVDAEEVYGYTR